MLITFMLYASEMALFSMPMFFVNYIVIIVFSKYLNATDYIYNFFFNCETMCLCIGC